MKIIALFGKSGAGKDTLLKMVMCTYPDLHKIITTTTRPMRDYETQGKEYHFVEPAVFAEKILNGDLIEATSFNNWFYGTDINQLKEDKINIGVFSITSIECLLEDDKLDVYPVLIDASDKVRLIRTLNREDNPDCKEICRRFFADEQDFDDIPFDYMTIRNNELSTDWVDAFESLVNDLI